MKVQDSLLKKVDEILRISIFLVLSMFELWQHLRDESAEKLGQSNHEWKIGSKKRNACITKERTLVLPVSF